MGHPGLNNLREKEKAVLRLLVQGYDAKTAAREMNVTPNVINEHLRAARKKLGVTNSKQAARLLAEAEGNPHKIFVPKDFGIVSAPQSPPIHPLPDQQAATSDQNVVREMQASYQAYATPPAPVLSVPLRKKGELGNDLNRAERVKAVVDLTVKLASAFAFICLAAMLLSTLITRT